MKPLKAITKILKSKLDAIDKIHQVYSDPVSAFSGYPAAYIIPSDIDSEFETNKDNDRTYNFYIRIFYNVGNKDEPASKAWEAMTDLVDDVVDAFDSDYQLDGIDLDEKYSVPRVNAVPSAWIYLQEENLLMSEIKISVRVSVDISSEGN